MENTRHNEDRAFLTEQIITYIGNKRALLGHLHPVFSGIQEDLGGRALVCVDLFSGSGVVARLLKQFSALLIANDLELYSQVINSCYLSNRDELDTAAYDQARREIEARVALGPAPGLVSRHYAPRDDRDIQPGERVFFTTRNAVTIDTLRRAIDGAPQGLQKYFLAPLLYGVSVHNNTGGVFKGFYKGRDGVGRLGGAGENALNRITGEIGLPRPVFSRHRCAVQVLRQDAAELVEALPRADILYLDPPYNQHPYGSNYFMLNLVARNTLEGPVSPVSGIPAGWNRSAYNRRQDALAALEDVVARARARFVVLSYNSEGFISHEACVAMLEKYGRVSAHAIRYNAYRASRNLAKRPKHVREYIFVLEKRPEA